MDNLKFKKKLELTFLGCLFTILNISLIETRFNIVGLGFGIVSLIFFFKAYRIKE
jgi:hypothetical protein